MARPTLKTSTFKTRTRPQKAQSLRNLKRRFPAPARGNGRVQWACRRALWALGEAPTSEILQFAYALKRHGGGRIEEWDGWSTRRALASIGAIRTGKLWRLPADY
jgi:hypothetical protein